MTDWDDLERELNAWEESSLQPTFWWRDDDVVRATSSLRRLLDLSERHGVPIALSVIPLRADRSLRSLLVGHSLVTVLQHGFSHRNYCPPGEPRCELSARRPRGEMIREIEAGRAKLQEMFPDKGRAVLVPPWGRMSEELIPALADIGFEGVSSGGVRQDLEPVPDMRRVNVHVDIVEWGTPTGRLTAVLARAVRFVGRRHATSRGFVGLSSALDQVLRHLAGRRTGATEVTEATGLMTHHHAHDEACWEFVDNFLARTRSRPTVRWLSVAELLDNSG